MPAHLPLGRTPIRKRYGGYGALGSTSERPGPSAVCRRAAPRGGLALTRDFGHARSTDASEPINERWGQICVIADQEHDSAGLQAGRHCRSICRKERATQGPGMCGMQTADSSAQGRLKRGGAPPTTSKPICAGPGIIGGVRGGDCEVVGRIAAKGTRKIGSEG